MKRIFAVALILLAPLMSKAQAALVLGEIDMGILARGGFSFELSKRVLDLPLEEFNKLLRII